MNEIFGDLAVFQMGVSSQSKECGTHHGKIWLHWKPFILPV